MNHIDFSRMSHQFGVDAAVVAARELGIPERFISHWSRRADLAAAPLSRRRA